VEYRLSKEADDSSNPEWAVAGRRVRIKSDPGRSGVLTGAHIAGRASVRLEVSFLDGSGNEFLPLLALEPVADGPPNVYQELRNLRFRSAAELRASLTYFRLSGRLAEVVYSLNTTNTEFLAYQFKPVLSFLDSPSRALLIADEVGLGKTIEAGLIWTELRSRDDAKRLLVLCPAMLCTKWQRELAEKFGVDAEICTASETLERLREVSAGRKQGFAVIGSLQGLRPPRGWNDLEEGGDRGAAQLARFLLERQADDPLMDLTVIDEAHYLRNPETQTAQLGRLIRPITANLVLLSATPIQLHSADLFHLLNLVDADTFAYEGSFAELLTDAAPLIALRDRILREVMTADDFLRSLTTIRASARLTDSSVLSRIASRPPTSANMADHAFRVDLARRLDAVNPLSKVISRTRKRDVQEKRVVRYPVAIRATLSPSERAFYDEVTDRVRKHCSRTGSHEGFLLTVPQRQLCSSMPAAIRAWRERIDSLSETATEANVDLEVLDGDRSPKYDLGGPLLDELRRIATSDGVYERLRAGDSKFELLLRTLLDYWRQYPDRKVVLFSYFRATLRYLAERMEEAGVRSTLLMGGMDKVGILDEFATPGGSRILLSSEVASEGVDLQFASLLINYDLPWNPMRVEQRIGRIDRIGQKADRIVIWNFFYSDTLDDRVYSRLFERLGIFEQALGSTEAVLGEVIQDMTHTLLSHRLTPEEEAAVIEQTRLALQNRTRIEEELESEATSLIVHGAYLQARINEARELQRYVTGEDLLVYVREFLRRHYPGGQFVTDAAQGNAAELELSTEARLDFRDFLERTREVGRSKLALPAAGRTRCLFDNKVRIPRGDHEIVTQYHPLTRFINQRLKALERDRVTALVAVQLGRFEAVGVDPGRYVFAVQRWSFSGEREWESLGYAAIGLESGVALPNDSAERLVNKATLRSTDWVEASAGVDGGAAEALLLECVDSLDQRFDEYVGNMRSENEDRIALQMSLAERQRQSRGDSLRRRIDGLKAAGKIKAVRLFEAQLLRHDERSAERIVELQRKKGITSSSRLIAAGVVSLV
jgi:superfamily II DNA or RNA helicase